MRRRIWIGILEIWENLKYILTAVNAIVSLSHDSGYTFVSCNLSLPPLLVDLLEPPWETGIEIPEAAELERGETTQKGRRKTTKKQKPPRAWILCVIPVCWQTSAEPQHWEDCAARLQLSPLAQFQRNKGQAPLSSQIQPRRSACRTHSIPPVLCLTP